MFEPMKKKQLFIIVGALIIFYGIYVIYSMYNKPHQNITETPADYSLTVEAFYGEFSADEIEATSKYNDKVIALDGKVSRVNLSGDGLAYIVLTGNGATVNCEFVQENVQGIDENNVGEQVTIKGLFVGYDDLLGEIQLRKCSIISLDLKQ